jgi:AraC-like DNA-binding protein/quercetin dioxygenase-like cupin family protein
MKRYFKHKPENLINITKIVTVNHFEFEKDFIFGGESHDFWEIVYADRESLICTADSRVINLKEGELLFHKPGEFHSLAANGYKAPSVYILSFVCKSAAMKFFEGKKLAPNKNFAKYIYSIFDESARTFDVPFSDPKQKKMALRELPSLGGGQIIKNYLEIFLINLLRFYTETESGNEIFLQSDRLSSKPVDEVMKVLKANVLGTLSIDEICSQTSYGRAYLFRVFKAETGKSIIEYFLELKMEKAKQFILEGKMTVKEIAAELSFNEPNYFTKTFKRIVGVTPSAYKKRAKQFLANNS